MRKNPPLAGAWPVGKMVLVVAGAIVGSRSAVVQKLGCPGGDLTLYPCSDLGTNECYPAVAELDGDWEPTFSTISVQHRSAHRGLAAGILQADQ